MRPPPQLAILPTHVREGNLIVLSGEGPREANGYLHTGKVDADVAVDEAYARARLIGVNLQSILRNFLGDLGRIKRIVMLLGMVNAQPEFAGLPAVINGCSDLFVKVLCDRGEQARSPSVSARCRNTSRSRSRLWSPSRIMRRQTP